VVLYESRGAAPEEAEDVSVESFHSNDKHVNVQGRERGLAEESGERRRVALNFQDVDIPVLACSFVRIAAKTKRSTC
jgi:hypothetical protein